MDVISQVLFLLALVFPLLTITFAWRSYTDIAITQRVFIGFLFGLILSCICFYLSMIILFRDGMGPG